MEIIEVLEDNAVDIRIVGDLDANSSIELDTHLQKIFDKGQFCLYIDCSELRYISSAGLGVFISHLESLKQKKGSFVFYNMNDLVQETFKILGLNEVMSIAVNKEDARKLMNESQY